MNVLLWVLQGIMAFLTIPHGVLTLLNRGDTGTYAYVGYGPPGTAGRVVRVDEGASREQRWRGELALCLGILLILPGLVDTAVVLTPIAALALLVPAVGGPAKSLKDGEIGLPYWFFGTLYLAAAPVLVAWGRLGPHPL